MRFNFRFISPHSLGGRILTVLGSALLFSMILFALSVFYFTYRTESAAWRGRQSEAARNAAGTVSAFLRRVEDNLTMLSIVEPDYLVTDPDELQGVLDQNPALLEIIRIDTQGSVIAAIHRDNSVLENLITIPQSQWFLQARAGNTYIGNVQLSSKNEPYLIMAVPSQDGGVVAARVEMKVLWEVVQNIHFGSSGQVYVVSRDGQVIAHTNPGVVLNNTTIQDRPEFTALTAAPNNEWFGTFINFLGSRVVGNTMAIQGTNWLVITELPWKEAFSATRYSIIVLGAVALLLLVMVNWTVIHYVRRVIVNPMKRLREGTEIIGQGNLDHRIGLDRDDEIGQLAAAFDTMAGKLHDRDVRLEDQTRATAASEARYRAIVEDQTELICRYKPDGVLTFVNEAYCRYFGKSREELIGYSFVPLILEEDRTFVESQFALLGPSRPVVTYEHRVILPDGSLRWNSWTDRVLFSAQGEIVEYAAVGRDVTERKLAQKALEASEADLRRLNLELEERIRERTAELRESEERYMLAVRGANDGLWDWDLKTNKIYFSPRWKSMIDYQEEELQNEPDEWLRRIHPDDLIHFQEMLDTLNFSDASHFEIEYRMFDRNENLHWMLCRGLVVRDASGTAYRMTGSQTDISDRKLVEERLAHDALHDSLTGLPNRVLFIDRIEQRLEHGKRYPEDIFALLFIDLDRFKIINDSLGHAIGDKYLISTARTLQSCLRPDDTICRLGGDEFAILLTEIRDVSDAVRVAERIQTHLKSTTMLGPALPSSTASIGITVFTGNYTSPEEMLRDADSAMYRAKAQGGGRYQIFDIDMYKSAMALLQLETDLKRAVERQEWEVHYQPVISLADRTINGVEALVRWRHPEKGIIPPGQFIPIAEESELIVQIGNYVLNVACRQVKKWRGAGNSKLWVSVNLSARQFQDQSLVKTIHNILRETGLPSDGLRLEVTETVAMKDLEYSTKILNELNDLGIHLSLDDFGNGHSSLGYLKGFPIKSLKIDRSFIRDIDMDKNSEAITSAIISLGHILKLEVVAEGVETSEQFSYLKSKLCDQIQGYLFSKPLPEHEMSKLIQKQNPFAEQPDVSA